MWVKICPKFLKIVIKIIKKSYFQSIVENSYNCVTNTLDNFQRQLIIDILQFGNFTHHTLSLVFKLLIPLAHLTQFSQFLLQASDLILVQLHFHQLTSDIEATLQNPNVITNITYPTNKVSISVQADQVAPEYVIQGEKCSSENVVSPFECKVVRISVFGELRISHFLVFREISNEFVHCPQNLNLLEYSQSSSSSR